MNKLSLALCIGLALAGCKKDGKTTDVKEPLPKQTAASAATPEEAFKMYRAATSKQDGAAIWDLGCNENKKKLESDPRPPELATAIGITVEEMNQMSARDLFIKLVSVMPADTRPFPTEMKTEAIDDTKSKVIYMDGVLRCEVTTCKDPDGWKFDIETCEGGG
jgi:hypothetical protein